MSFFSYGPQFYSERKEQNKMKFYEQLSQQEHIVENGDLIRITVERLSKTIEVKPFPKMMESVNNGNHVFFFEPGKGVVVTLGPARFNSYGIGEYCSSFAMENFKDI